MATKQDKSGGNENRQMRLNLTDLDKGEEKPSIVVTALDSNLQPLHTAEVDDNGNFNVPQGILDKAHRITIGPKTDKDQEVQPDSVLTYRTSQFTELIQNDALNIARLNWNKWRFFIRCVTGRVRLCRRPPWWYYNLVKAVTNIGQNLRNITPSVSIRNITPSVSISKFLSLERVSPSLSELIYGPVRCQPICIGTVEVYRRVCCCQPWIIDDLRLPDLIHHLEDVIRVIPDLPVDPNPPDPPPEIEKAFFKDGTLNELAINAPNDLAAIRALPKAEIAGYINARPYLICRGYSCSRPVRVATGYINPNGRFNICWSGFPTILRPFCHEEFAYIVKQKISGITYTIYNGIAANQWYERNEDVVLSSYSRYALACRDNEGSGAFALLDIIGDTESWNLKTPDATGWDRVAIPAYNDGLVFPAPSPAAALGANLNRNWGGTLKLNYKFSEGMKAIGARYYRISISEADNNGNPTGTREYLSDGLVWKKFVVVGTDIVTQSENLGPDTVGGNPNLFKIPYNADGAWLAGQYHGFLNTNDSRWSNPDKRHLVTIEVFDSAGTRLRPNGTPATGLPGSETQANFTYRRSFQDLGPTANVPFAALTHMFWWDNQKFIASIEYLNLNSIESLGECQFLVGGENSTFGIGYRAYHPNEMFQLSHRISWKRGLGSTSGSLLNSASNNVGQPLNPPGNSPTNTFHQMLHSNPSDPSDPHKLKKCAFTVFLTIYAKTTDGDDFGNPSVQDTAAFALEIT